MTITSHGLTVKAYRCSECGARSGREIDIEICHAKHTLRCLLMKAAGLDWQKMRGFDPITDPAFKQVGRNRAKKLRGEGLEEKNREAVKRRYVRKKGTA